MQRSFAMAEAELSESEAGNLALFLKAVHTYLAPVLKDVRKNRDDADPLSVASMYETAYSAVLPQYLIKYGFEEVKQMLAPGTDGPPQWTTALLPLDTDHAVERAYLSYLATEVLDLHKNHGGDKELLTGKRLGEILQADEELGSLQRDIGFCISAELGVHLHGPCYAVGGEGHNETLKLLESACRTGTAVEVRELLGRMGCNPLDSPLERGCEAANKRLPDVPSRMAPPNFEVKNPMGVEDADEEDVRVKEDRPTPMLVVSCHCGNLEVATLLVKRFGAYTMAHNQDTEEKYTALYAAVLTTPNAEIVKLLLDHGAWAWIPVALRTRDMFGWSVQQHPLLKLAIRNRIDLPIIDLLLDHGAMSKLDDDGKIGILESAAKAGRVDVMRSLIDKHGVAVDRTPPEASDDEFDNSEHRVYTPLMGAVANRHAAATALLLERNADPNQLYPSVTAVTQYNTPLRLAAQRGDAASIRLLRQHKAEWSKMRDVFLWGSRDVTVPGQVELQDALVGYGTADELRVEAVQALLETGAEVSKFMGELAAGSAEHVPHQWKAIGEDARGKIAKLLLEAKDVQPVAKAPKV